MLLNWKDVLVLYPGAVFLGISVTFQKKTLFKKEFDVAVFYNKRLTKFNHKDLYWAIRSYW